MTVEGCCLFFITLYRDVPSRRSGMLLANFSYSCFKMRLATYGRNQATWPNQRSFFPPETWILELSSSRLALKYSGSFYFSALPPLAWGFHPHDHKIASALPAIATAFQEGRMEKHNIQDIPSSFSILVHSVWLQNFTSASFAWRISLVFPIHVQRELMPQESLLNQRLTGAGV